jgi:hypothetical protein
VTRPFGQKIGQYCHAIAKNISRINILFDKEIHENDVNILTYVKDVGCVNVGPRLFGAF